MSPTAVNLANENVEFASLKSEAILAPGLAVKAGVAARTAILAGAGEKPLGFVNDGSEVSGEGISIAILKPGAIFSKCLSGAAIAAVETDLMLDAAGKLVTATITNNIVGQNIHAVPGANEIVSLRLLYPARP